MSYSGPAAVGTLKRRGDPARQPVEIVVGSERFATVGHAAFGRRVQVDHVEVGRVGQRMAAEPSKPEHDQFGAGNDAVRLPNSSSAASAQRDQRAFGDSA